MTRPSPPTAADAGGRPPLPEERLMLAVLERAVKDFLGIGNLVPWEVQSAVDFFFEDEDDGPFCLKRIAEHVGMDVETIRARVMRMTGVDRKKGWG